MARLRRWGVPTALSVVCVLALVATTVAATRSAVSGVVLTQSGHWVANQAARKVLHVHGDTEEVDAQVALPNDAAQEASTALQGGTAGFVVGRDRAWTFDKANQKVTSSAPLPDGGEQPVDIETPGGPYLVYRQQGRIVRLGQPPVAVEPGGPLGPPVRTSDGTVWVHRTKAGELCAFRRDAVTLDCAAHVAADTLGALTVIGDRATFVDTDTDLAHVVRSGDQDAGIGLGADLPSDVLLADQSTSSRLPVVLPGSNRLLLLDTAGIADGRGAAPPLNVELGLGTFSGPMVSGDVVAVLELTTSTLSTFGADGHRVEELRLAPRTGAADVHRGEDGRLYVDDHGGAHTHIVRRDGTISTLDLGLGAAGDAVAAAPPQSQLNPIAPPPPGRLIVPRPAPGPVPPTQGPIVAAPPGSGSGKPGSGTGVPPTGPASPPPVVEEMPATPTAVTAALTGPDVATITWADGIGGGPAQSYDVISSQGGKVTATSGKVDFPNLIAGTTYTFTVIAINGAGSSGASAPSNPVTPSPVSSIQPPDPPLNLAITLTSAGADVSWAQPDLHGGTFLRYEVTLTPSTASGPRTVTGTSTRFSAPADFDACKPVTVAVVTVTSAGTSKPARGSSAPKCVGSTLRLTPATATVAAGGTLTVTIMITVGTKPVNAVQANLSFPAGQLKCTSIAIGGPWDVTAEKTCGSGEARIAVGKIPPPVSGTVAIATVTFTGVAPGMAGVQFASGTSALAHEDNSETLRSTNGATYTIT